MKLVLFSFLFVFLIINPVQAQSTDTLHKGYAVNAFLFNGYAASVKFPCQGPLNFRILFDFSSAYNGNNSSGNRINMYSSDTTPYPYHFDSSRTSFNLTISPQCYYNIFINDLAAVYIGAGPFISFNYSKSAFGYNFYSGPNLHYSNFSNNKYSSTTWSSGLSLFIGVGGYLSRNISLFVESQVNGGYSSGRQSYEEFNDYYSHNTESYLNNGWFANLINIRAGFGIYF
jgi:hypothetical protein